MTVAATTGPLPPQTFGTPLAATPEDYAAARAIYQMLGGDGNWSKADQQLYDSLAGDGKLDQADVQKAKSYQEKTGVLPPSQPMANTTKNAKAVEAVYNKLSADGDWSESDQYVFDLITKDGSIDQDDMNFVDAFVGLQGLLAVTADVDGDGKLSRSETQNALMALNRLGGGQPLSMESSYDLLAPMSTLLKDPGTYEKFMVDGRIDASELASITPNPVRKIL
jgi:hypothetical protein